LKTRVVWVQKRADFPRSRKKEKTPMSRGEKEKKRGGSPKGGGRLVFFKKKRKQKKNARREKIELRQKGQCPRYRVFSSCRKKKTRKTTPI